MDIIGQLRVFLIGGRKIPGVIVGDAHSDVVEYPSKDPARNGQLVHRRVQRAEAITLRETNPANGPVRTYLTKTDEDLAYTFLRTDKVVGLDVHEDGTPIDFYELQELTAESMANYQLQRLANAVVREPSLDIDLMAPADEVDETKAATA